MVTIYLSGGLGNQLFQFSTGYALAKVKKTDLVINISSYSSNIRSYELNVFENIEIKYKIQKKSWKSSWSILRLLSYFFENSVVTEKHPFKYDPSIFNCKKNTNLFGYFQSEKYFINYRDELLGLLSFPPIIDDELIKLKSIICLENSVSIHVRRGDYVSNPQTTAYHGVMPIAYYKKAIERISKKISNPSFYVFSDDPEWVANNFNFIPQYTLVDVNKGRNSFRDIELMSYCKHNIIANSSFSWWGAWLNKNKNKNKIVVAPKNWVSKKTEPLDDVTPEAWTLI